MIEKVNTFSYQQKNKVTVTMPKSLSSKDKVSFGYSFFAKNLKNVPCACCGRKTIPSKVINKIEWPQDPLERGLLDVITELSKRKDMINDAGQNLLRRLIIFEKNYPNQTLNKALGIIGHRTSSLVEKYRYQGLSKAEQTEKMLNLVEGFRKDLHPVEKRFLDSLELKWEKFPNSTILGLT